MLVADVVKICESASSLSIAEHLSTLKGKHQQQTKFEEEPHVLLCKLISESTTLDNKSDPKIKDTVKYLQDLREQIDDDMDLRNNVKLLSVKLEKAYQVYSKEMRTRCFSSFFCSREQMVPGFTASFLGNMTFKKSLTDERFKRYVNLTFHPSLHIIRATSRLLDGFDTGKVDTKPTHLGEPTSDSLHDGSHFKAVIPSDNRSSVKKHKTQGINSELDMSSSVYETDRAMKSAESEMLRTKEVMKDLTRKWLALGPRLESIGFGNMQDIPKLSSIAACNELYTRWSRFAFVVENTKASVRPPPVTMEDSVVNTVAALLDDWTNLLKTQPTADDLHIKFVGQRRDMLSTIATKCEGVVRDDSTVEELEVIRNAWIKKVVFEQLLPRGTRSLAEQTGPTTYNTFFENAQQIDASIAVIQPGCDELGVSTSGLRELKKNVADVTMLPIFNPLEHQQVHVLWENSLAVAIRIDTAFYMLSFLKVFEPLLRSGNAAQMVLVAEQRAMKSVIVSFRIATTAMEQCMHKISEDGTKLLINNFQLQLVPIAKKLIEESTRIASALEKEGVSVRLQRKQDVLTAIESYVVNCKHGLTRLGSASVTASSATTVLKTLRELWAKLSNESQIVIQASQTSNIQSTMSSSSSSSSSTNEQTIFIYHLQNAIQECEVVIQESTVNKTLSLKQMSGIGTYLIGAHHLLWALNHQSKLDKQHQQDDPEDVL